MRKYSSNLAFVDLLFNLLVGFTSLFVIAFLMINPVAKTGVVTPPNLFMVELLWDDKSRVDLDLHVRGPDGTRVYYGHKDGNYFHLERDDLGATSDRYVIDNREVTVERNYEVITFSALPPGEYVVNVHYYSVRGEPEMATVRATSLTPYKVISETSTVVGVQEEVTSVSFVVNRDGSVSDVRTDLQIPLRGRGGISP